MEGSVKYRQDQAGNFQIVEPEQGEAMSNELSIYKDYNGLQRAAKDLFQSGYFSDAKNEAQAIVKVMAGLELGLPPFASMAGVHIIQGKPTLGSNVIATLVKNDPRYNYRVKQTDDEACILEWYEDGAISGEAGFTIKEAEAAGLTNKDNWRKYTSDMLFARAISRGARRFAPGIFGGSPVYTPDEMGVETDEEGFIDVKVIDIEPDEDAPSSPVGNGNGNGNGEPGKQLVHFKKAKELNNGEPPTVAWLVEHHPDTAQWYMTNTEGDTADAINAYTERLLILDRQAREEGQILEVDPDTGEVLNFSEEDVNVKRGEIVLRLPSSKNDWGPISEFVEAHPDLTGKDMAQIRKDNLSDALLVYSFLKEHYA